MHLITDVLLSFNQNEKAQERQLLMYFCTRARLRTQTLLLALTKTQVIA